MKRRLKSEHLQPGREGAAAEYGTLSAGPGAGSAAGNEAPMGAVAGDRARVAGPGATLALGHEKSVLEEAHEVLLCSSTAGELARCFPVLERTRRRGMPRILGPELRRGQ